MSIFRSRPAQVVTLLLLLQAALLYSSVRQELLPVSRPLNELPHQFGAWTLAQEGVVEQEILDTLRADDLVNRTYKRADEAHPAMLFVAFFRTQRTGKTPHSPKNCLPGSGWLPVVAQQTVIESGLGPINANRYLISRGEHRAVVLYWYQSRDRTVASEYKAKLFMIADAMRFNRSDTSLVKITVPMVGSDDRQAEAAAEDFLRAFYPTLMQFLPR
jgi:EpsI family protein